MGVRPSYTYDGRRRLIGKVTGLSNYGWEYDQNDNHGGLQFMKWMQAVV